VQMATKRVENGLACQERNERKASRGTMGTVDEGKRIAVLPFDGVGHLNPQLALVAELQGSSAASAIKYYLMTKKNKPAVEALGVDVVVLSEMDDIHRGFKPVSEQSASDLSVNDLAVATAKQCLEHLDALLDDLRVFQPSLIIYDPFSLLGMMAARVLGIPSVCTITVPALNSYPILSGLASEEEKRRKLQDYRDSSTLSKIGGALKKRWGINPVEEAVLMSCYVPKGLNICTGIVEFEQKMPDAVKAIYGDLACTYVGPMLRKAGRVSTQERPSVRQWIDEDFPMADFKRMKEEEGKKVVYMSFGTVATSPVMWNYEGPMGKMTGAKQNGKTFCRSLWSRAFDAFGKDDSLVVVLATCNPSLDALDGLGPIPSNFIVRRKCPQLEILEVADAFVTHGGANSMMESIAASVPMLVLPWFSDQHDNGAIVSREKLGLSFSDPVKDCSIALLKSNVQILFQDKDGAFASNLARVRKKLSDAGGVAKAVEAIEAYLNSYQANV